MSIYFKPTAAQQSDLDEFLRQQQEPASPNYHRWLTPEQFGARFGMSASDLAKVSAWLQAHGFSNITVSRSRTSIEFDGNAGQVATAFHAPIHQLVLNGETHYANISSPQLPSAFAGAVAGITSLNNFRPRPKSIAHFTSSVSGNHFLVPGDVGTIYNINSLYTSGIDGSGQAIAVVGQTPLTNPYDGTHTDIDRFRSLASLPAINLQLTKTGTPTYSADDVDEANLDIEWSGAIAPKAQVIFVYSENALFTSLPYIVTNNLAPVISISYGNCEANFDASSVTVLTQVLTQANAQGQTLIAASGDAGAADCESASATTATHGLAVDVPAATQYVTGMGGSEFTGDDAGTVNNGTASETPYWKGSSSETDTSATAKSYIPEIVWNDSDSNGIAAGGGGVSTLFTKPTWQTGPGVPADGQRDVPDVSLSSSPNHDGYLICTKGGCVDGFRKSDQSLTVIGGTSVASPVFAGVVALMNQKFGTRLGNVNPTLYSLAATTSNNAFHDITSGNNMVSCQAGSKDCGASGMIGYSAGAGYDLASGLGSMDIGAVVAAWNGGMSADFTVSANPTSLALVRGGTGSSTIAVTGTGAPLGGSVSLTCSVSSTLGATTCSVSPNSVNPGQSATLSMTATNSAALHRSPLGVSFGFGVAAFCLIPALGTSRFSRRTLRNVFLSTLGLALVLGFMACGGGGSNNSNNNSVTPLSGSVTVQAVSGSLSHSVVIPVTIN
jgi:subtilase family serine protease